MKTYYVYFDQVNAQKYEIRARNEIEAQAKAERRWNRENKNQPVSGIEELKPTEWKPHPELSRFEQRFSEYGYLETRLATKAGK